MPLEGPSAQSYRDKAGRIRALAEGFGVPDTKEQLLRIADQYERLAQQDEIVRPLAEQV